MKVSAPITMVALLAACFTLTTWIEPRVEAERSPEAGSGDLLTVMFGDGRRLFANHFFVKADVYFHSGYYPSIFDDRQLHEENHLKRGGETPDVHSTNAVPGAAEHHEEHHDEKDEHDHDHDDEADFLGKPQDWIDAFGRNFYVTQHTHLERNGLEREMLPWLDISARLDPHRVETYTVAGYWLRTRLGKVDEAEQFLRQGLRENPGDPALLYELGALMEENRKDIDRARNLWEMALTRWQQIEAGKKEPDMFLLSAITARLARLEYTHGRYAEAIEHLKLLKLLTPDPAAIQKQIDELTPLLKK